MPDPERLLRTLQRAASEFRAMPGRRGRVVTLADVQDVMVAGDLHGNLGLFQELIHRADLASHPHRHLVVQELIHGPHRYPDDSDKSHQLVDVLAALKCQFPRQVHYLLGNHEVAQASGRTVGKGDDTCNVLFRRGLTAAYGDKSEDIYVAYIQLFTAAPLALRTPNRVFISHSLPPAVKLPQWSLAVIERDIPDPSDLQPGGSVYQLVWGRDASEESARGFLKKVDADLLVTGHIPCDGGFAIPNPMQVVVDCQDSPGGYCFFPADRPISHTDLVKCLHTI